MSMKLFELIKEDLDQELGYCEDMFLDDEIKE